MPIDFPTFDAKYGLLCCVCGEPEVSAGELKRHKTVVARQSTPQGDVFIRAWIDTPPHQRLYVNWARSDCFAEGKAPKVTADKAGDVLSVVESARNLTLQATVCASFAAPLRDLPERGMIRPMLSAGKGAGVSVRMTAATLALTGLPISRVEWKLVTRGKRQKMVRVDLMGRKKFTVGDTYLTDVWRWIYEQFTIFVLGHAQSGPNPKGS
jgi:hypothetical protein